MPFLVSKLFKFIPKDLLTDSNSSINKYIMNFLSIDCSTDVGSLFIKVKNKTFSKVLQSDKFNNDLLMKQILNFFEENYMELDDISQIFVNQGPGNFAGLRGSLAIAKGISLSKNINLFGYNTFIWACARFSSRAGSICSLIKFREKYFIKKFDKNLNIASNVEEITKEEIIKNYDDKFKVVPKNLIKHFDKKILNLNNLNIVNLDHNELEFLQFNDLLDKESIIPLYLG